MFDERAKKQIAEQMDRASARTMVYDGKVDEDYSETFQSAVNVTLYTLGYFPRYTETGCVIDRMIEDGKPVEPNFAGTSNALNNAIRDAMDSDGWLRKVDVTHFNVLVWIMGLAGYSAHAVEDKERDGVRFEFVAGEVDGSTSRLVD